jgi:hypothetical protein
VDAGLAAVSPARGHALRVLIAFIGGVLGSAYALSKFADAAYAVCDRGVDAKPQVFAAQAITVHTRIVAPDVMAAAHQALPVNNPT